MADITCMAYSPAQIAGKRAEVARNFIERSENISSFSVERISGADLRLLFELYDEIFFEEWFRKNYPGKMKFSLSSRMTKSAGVTLCPKSIARIRPEEVTIEIRIGINLLFQYGAVGGGKNVCGIKTGNNLEALMLVFEHELCHTLEFILFKKSSCSGERFRQLASSLFGHTERYHALPVIKQNAAHKTTKRVGDHVKFDFKGRELSGIVYSINKRAAVLVRDKGGRYADRQGNLYSKYYVPVQMLY